MTFEIRQCINDAHEMIERSGIRITESHGWIQLAALLRDLSEYLDKADQACENDDPVEAVGWFKGAADEIGRLPDEANHALHKLYQMDKGFVGAACWLWTERQFAVPYDDSCCDGYANWFKGFDTLVELETTLPAYCEYADKKPSPEWCLHIDGELWLHESHLFPLVQFADVKFQMFIVQKIKHMLRESPAREHHQAKLHTACPQVHNLLFPDAIAEGS